MTSEDQAPASDKPAKTGASQDVASAWQALAPLMDLITPMALRVVTTLRLADLMPDSHDDGPGADVEELAIQTGTDQEALARTLRHLVRQGVFTEPSPGRFAATATAALLRTGQPAAQWLDLDGFGGQMDLAFTALLHTVRTGEPAWEQVFGQPFWGYLDAHPAHKASFDAFMAVGVANVAVAQAYDWSTMSHVADVGGGTGTFLAEVLRHSPHLRGTLVDLPETVARGRENLAGLGLAERCEFVGQSFFDPLPTGADAYLLSRVIHDWDDDDARAILRRCAEAAGGSGRVLMIESAANTTDPASFAEMNLRMLVLVGGRERTLDDYTALAASAGLRVAAVHQPSDQAIVVECVPGQAGQGS